MIATVLWEGEMVYGTSLEVDPVKKGGLLQILFTTDAAVELKKLEAEVKPFPDTLVNSSVTFIDDSGVSRTGMSFTKENFELAAGVSALAINISIRIRADVYSLEETVEATVGWQEII